MVLFSVYVTALFLNTFLSLFVAGVAFRLRSKPGGLSLAYLMLAIAEWSLALAFEFMSTTLASKIFWSKIEYLGIVSAPVLLFIFALSFTQREKWLRRRYLYLYWLFPLITLILALTNERHHLIWTHFTPIPADHFLIAYGHGSWFWVMTAYFYMLVLVASIMLIQAALHYRHIYRQQAITLLISVFPPWISNMLYVFEAGPFPGLDLTPVSFAATGVLLTLNFVRMQLLDLVPIARERTVDNMHDSLIVLDVQERVIDVNPAAQTLIGLPPHEIIGKPAADVLGRWPELTERFRTALTVDVEVHIEGLGYIELQIFPLYGRYGHLAGRAIISHDINQRKQAQIQLEQAHEDLEQRVIERTAQLAAANKRLQQEINKRQQAEDKVQALNVILEQRVADRTRELTALYEVSAVANRPLDIETLSSEMLSQTTEAMQSTGGAIFLLEDPIRPCAPYVAFHLAACQGLSVEFWTQNGSFLGAQNLLRQLCPIPQMILIPDVEADPEAKVLWELKKPSILLAAPLHAGENILGLLVQLRPADKTFKREEIALLASIAEQISIAVESSRLRQLTLRTSLLQERERLARDLHDTVTQSLYGLVTLTELGKAQMEAGLPTVIPGTLTQIGETARHALKEMRLFIHQLRPPNLEKEGLIGALHQRLAAVEGRVGLQTRLLADETIHLTLEQQTDLYYIVQEALNNILRHANAQSITVYLGRERENVILEIRDDGCGFDPEHVSSGGMGLSNILQRTNAIGGTLKISSLPDQGTRIRVILGENS